MEIKGQRVNSKSEGQGEIIKVIHGSDGNEKPKYIQVRFDRSGSIKEFQFPSAFKEFLSAMEPLVTSYVQELLEIDTVKAKLPEPALPVTPVAQNKRSQKRRPKSNIAFRYTLCDGGANNKQVGFRGICSDKLMRNNVVIAKRPWCSSPDCDCAKRIAGKMTRMDLEENSRKDAWPCYESQILVDWTARAGAKASGEPMTIRGTQINSLCVLTTCDPDKDESLRYIFAMFLIGDVYEGKEGVYEGSQDYGYVVARNDFRVAFPPNVAKSLLFWNYHANGNRPEESAWSTGLHRYLDDTESAQMLMDAVRRTKDTSICVTLQNMLEYFSKINHLDLSIIQKPSGARFLADKSM